MDMHYGRRARATFFGLISNCAVIAPLQAATLAVFDFEDAQGHFVTTPTLLHAGLTTAVWSDDAGLLADFAGNPGRALGASGFPAGNTLHLTLDIAPGYVLDLARLRFDVRASASGPSAWTVTTAGIGALSGPTTAAFTAVDAVIGTAAASGLALIDFDGSGASSAAGTLRLDNVELLGELRPVSLPGSFFLFLTPMLGYVASRLRMRWWPQSGQSAMPALIPARAAIRARRRAVGNRVPA